MSQVTRISVLGAGTMGRGIAQLAAQNGISVGLFDVAPKVLAEAEQAIRAQLTRMVEKGKLSAAEGEAAGGRVEPGTDLESACSDAQIVIEAAPEQMALKIDLMTRAKGCVSPEALLASNTSSLS
ncbi:MAG TPA: 3-hydroxyacyl-CoA dehydrogenase NAD-binding domain-containing protein, partial [Polyangiaceae bacterium]|nr:3-hydroxyacyl-CoA dehydrogenase NAD-binding domain-containing protein [Polyangiaceae bacterium]